MICIEFRTISLMSHVTKLLLKIIQQRMANKIDEEVSRLQSGFQEVDRMVYLGYMATEDGKCDKEIKRRIGIARTAFESMPKILTSRNVSLELRSCIAKCYIWSTLLHVAETWTITNITSEKSEAFEMWLYRRMLRISWKEHKTNGEVLHKMKTKRSLLITIKKRKCQYFGHIIRGDGVQRLLMGGRINGRRGRGGGDREQCGRITSRNGQNYHIMTVSEWHKIENDGDP